MVPFKSIRAWEQENGARYHDLSPLSKLNVREGLRANQSKTNVISQANEKAKRRKDEEAP